MGETTFIKLAQQQLHEQNFLQFHPKVTFLLFLTIWFFFVSHKIFHPNTTTTIPRLTCDFKTADVLPSCRTSRLLWESPSLLLWSRLRSLTPQSSPQMELMGLFSSDKDKK